jgi:hypothetical protein
MLWLLQCLDGESSSGESPVPQIRSIDQFLLSRLFSSLTSSVNLNHCYSEGPNRIGVSLPSTEDGNIRFPKRCFLVISFYDLIILLFLLLFFIDISLGSIP